MFNKKKIKDLEASIELLEERVKLLEFFERANGQQYIANWSWVANAINSRKSIQIEFINRGKVLLEYKHFPTDVKRPRVVGKYVEVYEDIDGANILEAVYTQCDDHLTEVDLELYKKAKQNDTNLFKDTINALKENTDAES